MAGVAWSRGPAPVEGDRQGGPTVDEGGKGDGRGVLVLERITGNMWKSFTKQAWFHCIARGIRTASWIGYQKKSQVNNIM
jgi:hypothetical protein